MTMLLDKPGSSEAVHDMTDPVEDPFRIPTATGPIGAAIPRSRVALTGAVRRVELVEWQGGPVLEVDLDDGTGTIGLAFFGRRHAGALALDRCVTVAGTVGQRHGRPILLNPYLWLVDAHG